MKIELGDAGHLQWEGPLTEEIVRGFKNMLPLLKAIAEYNEQKRLARLYLLATGMTLVALGIGLLLWLVLWATP